MSAEQKPRCSWLPPAPMRGEGWSRMPTGATWTPTSSPPGSMLEMAGALDFKCSKDHEDRFSIHFLPKSGAVMLLCRACSPATNAAEIGISDLEGQAS